jgi:hypothetical protein
MVCSTALAKRSPYRFLLKLPHMAQRRIYSHLCQYRMLLLHMLLLHEPL